MSNSKIIERFNKQFPVGCKFRWRPISKGDSPYQDMTVRYPAYDLHGQAVAFAKEKSGCISIEEGFVDYQAAQVPT